jgi:hypothetical protein
VKADRIGIFDGYERLLASRLGCSNLRHRSAVFRKTPSEGPDVVRALFAEVDLAWSTAANSEAFRLSAENFRWLKPQLSLGGNNRSPETTLERALISACCRLGRTDWTNQVPLISGLAGSRAYKRRAIDLVHRVAAKHFEFVELKIGSDTPLYAASEIVLYGLLWLLTCRDRSLLSLPASPLLDAKRLRLSVLAPRAFYADAELKDMTAFFNAGLLAVGERCGVELEFGFAAFPAEFRWPGKLSNESLVQLLDGREPV